MGFATNMPLMMGGQHFRFGFSGSRCIEKCRICLRTSAFLMPKTTPEMTPKMTGDAKGKPPMMSMTELGPVIPSFFCDFQQKNAERACPFFRAFE